MIFNCRIASLFDIKSRGVLIYFALLILFLPICSCSPIKDNAENVGVEKSGFERRTMVYQLHDEANPYMMTFTEHGYSYYVMEMSETESDNAIASFEDELRYMFYYQAYDREVPDFLCNVYGGYIGDYSVININDRRYLYVLKNEDSACILKYDDEGKLIEKLDIDDVFNQLSGRIKMCVIPAGGYLISKDNQLFHLEQDGQIFESWNLDGIVNKIFYTDNNEIYVCLEQNGDNGSCKLELLNKKGNDTGTMQSNLNDVLQVFKLEDGFVSVKYNSIVFFHVGKEDEQNLLLLKDHDFMASQIQYVFGNNKELQIVSMDLQDMEQKVFRYVFNIDNTRQQEIVDRERNEKEREKYTSDGRRIVYVVIPQDCFYQVDFHAKKFNQQNDKAVVKIERLEEPLEDYLGKGFRPDIIMFRDQTEINDYIEKGVLVNLYPLFQNMNENYYDDIIPKVKELLGIEKNNEFYSIAGLFRLLIRYSDDTETDQDGKCDAIRYFKWYDNYLTNNGITGIGSIENILYANVNAFYDENSATASFVSSTFKELMQEYKDVYTRHKGVLDEKNIQFNMGLKALRYSQGARWLAGFTPMRDPRVSIKGLPGLNGEDKVFIQLLYPMSILDTSECREEAFDFITYFIALPQILSVTDPVGLYGSYVYNINPRFFIFESYLNREIFETEKPYTTVEAKTDDGEIIQGKYEDVYYTDEQKEQLRHVIQNAVPTTAKQQMIYKMLLEEMDGYLNGNKDLDSACDILQNRVQLFLKEK